MRFLKVILLLCLPLVLLSGCQTDSDASAMYKEQIAVEQRVHSLFKQYGLEHWSFDWMFDEGRLYGRCLPIDAEIQLSRDMVWWNNKFTTDDVILHEVAHAIDWERNGEVGHGESWKAICREIGAPTSEFVDPDAIYEIE